MKRTAPENTKTPIDIVNEKRAEIEAIVKEKLNLDDEVDEKIRRIFTPKSDIPTTTTITTPSGETREIKALRPNELNLNIPPWNQLKLDREFWEKVLSNLEIKNYSTEDVDLYEMMNKIIGNEAIPLINSAQAGISQRSTMAFMDAEHIARDRFVSYASVYDPDANMNFMTAYLYYLKLKDALRPYADVIKVIPKLYEDKVAASSLKIYSEVPESINLFDTLRIVFKLHTTTRVNTYVFKVTKQDPLVLAIEFHRANGTTTKASIVTTYPVKRIRKFVNSTDVYIYVETTQNETKLLCLGRNSMGMEGPSKTIEGLVLAAEAYNKPVWNADDNYKYLVDVKAVLGWPADAKIIDISLMSELESQPGFSVDERKARRETVQRQVKQADKNIGIQIADLDFAKTTKYDDSKILVQVPIPAPLNIRTHAKSKRKELSVRDDFFIHVSKPVRLDVDNTPDSFHMAAIVEKVFDDKGGRVIELCLYRHQESPLDGMYTMTKKTAYIFGDENITTKKLADYPNGIDLADGRSIWSTIAMPENAIIMDFNLISPGFKKEGAPKEVHLFYVEFIIKEVLSMTSSTGEIVEYPQYHVINTEWCFFSEKEWRRLYMRPRRDKPPPETIIDHFAVYDSLRRANYKFFDVRLSTTDRNLRAGRFNGFYFKYNKTKLWTHMVFLLDTSVDVRSLSHIESRVVIGPEDDLTLCLVPVETILCYISVPNRTPGFEAINNITKIKIGTQPDIFEGGDLTLGALSLNNNNRNKKKNPVVSSRLQCRFCGVEARLRSKEDSLLYCDPLCKTLADKTYMMTIV